MAQCNILDVSQSKRAQEALYEANAYNRSLIEPSLDPLVTIGTDGKILDVNTATEALTGYARAELFHKDFSDYFTEPEKARAGYQKLFQEGFLRDYPLEIQHRDGHTTPVLYNTSLYQNDAGDIMGIFAAARDITARKQAEENLKASENKYRSFVENAVEGVFHVTPEGRYISVNPALARMIGYDTPEGFMKGVADTSKGGYVNPGDRVRYEKILEEEDVIQGFELQHYRKDGSIIWVSINAHVVRDSTGKVLYYEGTVQDITARKTAVENLRQNAEKLRKTLLGSIKALSMTVEARDAYTAGHQKRVSDLARTIAREMVLPSDTIDNIRIAGLIHDIGKTSIPAEILSKPGKLTELELGLVRAHPQTG